MTPSIPPQTPTQSSSHSLLDKCLLILLGTALVLGAYLPKVIGIIPFVFGLFGLAVMIKDRVRLQPGRLSNQGGAKLVLFSFIFFLLYILLNNLTSQFPEAGLKRTAGLWGIFILSTACLVKIDRLNKDYAKRFLRWLPPLVFAGIVFNIADISLGYPLYSFRVDEGDAIDGYLANRSISTLMLLSIPSLLTMHLSYKGTKRFIFQCTFLACLLFLITLGDSETAKLSVLVIGLGLLLFKLVGRVFLRVLGLGIIFAMLTGPMIVQSTFTHFAEDINKHSILGSGGAHGAQRLEIYDFVARYAMKKPILGHGLDAAREIKDFETAQKYHGSNTITHPHNFILQLWLELGLLGVVLAGAILIAMLESIRKSNRATGSYFSLFLACSFMYLVGYGLWQAWMLAIVVVTVALIRLAATTLSLAENTDKH